MSDRIRFAPVKPAAPARIAPHVSKVWREAWADFVRAALAAADAPRLDYLRSKLRGECVDAIRSWQLPFAERHDRETLGALPHLVRAFCHQPTARERAALSEALRSLSLRCLELLGDAAPAALAEPTPTLEPASPGDGEPRDWRARADLCG